MGNTTKQISARARARAASSRFYELEKRREEVMGRYFDAIDSVDKVYESRDRAIAKATEQAELAAADAQRSADASIRELIALKVPRSEIPDRLGCTSADVRRATSVNDEADARAATAHEVATGPEDASSPENDGEDSASLERADADAFAMQA